MEVIAPLPFGHALGGEKFLRCIDCGLAQFSHNFAPRGLLGLHNTPQPAEIVRGVRNSLANGETWVFEQQDYLPAIVEADAYAAVRPKGLMYFTLGQMAFLLGSYGLKITGLELAGLSFSITVARQTSRAPEFAGLGDLVAAEKAAGYDTAEPLLAFRDRMEAG